MLSFPVSSPTQNIVPRSLDGELGYFYPKYWTYEKDYGNDAITSFANHFRATLTAARYDEIKVLNDITLSLAQYCWNQQSMRREQRN